MAYVPDEVRMQLSEYMNRSSEGLTQTLFKRGIDPSERFQRGRGLSISHTSGGGFRKKKNGSPVFLTFHDRAGNEAASDDFLEQHNISDDIFTERIEPNRSNMISLIEYAPSRLLMRVAFVNKGSVVLYDHVPVSVFAHLKHVNDSGNSLGAVFWDLMNQYERASLSAPSGPGVIRPMRDYYPKRSNFVKRSVKYPFTTLERGYEVGMRRGAVGMDYETGEPRSYAPTVDKGTVTVTGAAKRNRRDMQELINVQRSGVLVRDPETRKTASKPARTLSGAMGTVRVPKNWLTGE